MNNDTLRKAVELADGWHLNDGEEKYAPHVWLEMSNPAMQSPSEYYFSWPMPKHALDALAAQLRRQVRALGMAVSVEPCQIKIGKPQFVGDSCILFHAKVYDNRKGDESENTITTIVESGVLDDGR